MLLVIGNYNYSSWSLRAWWPLMRTSLAFDTERIALDVADTAQRIRSFSSAGLLKPLP